MIKRNQSILNLINVLTDFVLIWLSILCAWNIRFDVMDGTLHVSMTTGGLFFTTAIYGLFNISILYVFRLYSPQRLKMTGSNNLRIFCANVICAMMLQAILFLFKIVDVPRLFILIGWFLSSLLVCIKHICLEKILKHFRKKGYNQKHYIVVGNGHLANQYIQDVKNNPFTGITVDGYISAVEKKELGRCLGSYEELETILGTGNYDGLVIALEAHEIGFMKHVLRAADKEGIQLEMIPFFNDYYPVHPTFESLGSSKLVNLRATPLNSVGGSFLKRMMDICTSSLLLIVLLPLLLIIAIGVKMSSPGPVFFKQERIGRGKKSFVMYKFRSMRMNDDEKTAWSKNVDNRKTRFGSIIRKLSLDELPQLWNVLKGDMSMIGPRPEIPFHVSHFKEEVPRYLIRQQVRPGITGLAQINGFRGDSSIEERLKYDVEYIENWSPSMDIVITWKTIFGGMINQEKI